MSVTKQFPPKHTDAVTDKTSLKNCNKTLHHTERNERYQGRIRCLITSTHKDTAILLRALENGILGQQLAGGPSTESLNWVRRIHHIFRGLCQWAASQFHHHTTHTWVIFTCMAEIKKVTFGKFNCRKFLTIGIQATPPCSCLLLPLPNSYLCADAHCSG